MPSFEPVKFGKYMLLDRIAVGGMAEVYRAKLIGEKGFEKPVVLKKMLPHLTDEEDMVNNFIDEARLATFLKHKNIIDIYDFGNESGTFFIAMEYLFGKDLHQIIKKALETDNPVDLENTIYIILKICEGLEYAHKLKNFEGNQLNIIHRDVSPHNIFITYEGQVKLLDFGIAKAASKSTKTQTGIIKGKAAYMSPEQAGGKPIDHRSDIFALGIILYELVTQKKMFEGDTFQILSQVIQAKFEPPENIIPSLNNNLYSIIHKSLKKAPEDRYQSCEEMVGEMEACSYELKYRLSSKKMSHYVQSLFEDQFEIEKKQMAHAMTCELNSESPPLSESDPQDSHCHTEAKDENIEKETPAALDSEVPYQQTEAFQKTPLTKNSTFKNGFHNLKVKAKDTLSRIRATRIQNRKHAAILCTVLILIISGITIGYVLKPHDENAIEIRNLLKKAEQSFNNSQIIFPETDSSLYYYQEVLKLDPDNKTAEKGLEKVVAECIQFAEKKILNSDLSVARKYVFAGLKIDPENQRLLEMKKKVVIGPRLLVDKLRNALQPAKD